jgi:hypothetical protein
MSYYLQSQYAPANEYSASTPRDPSYPHQWEQQQDQQDHHIQPQQPQEQPQQSHQPLSLPPPPHQSLYLEDPQQAVPSQSPTRGVHDSAPIRLLPPPGHLPPVEIKPVMLNTTVRSTAHPGTRARQHQYHPYPRPSSASGSSAAMHRREVEAHHHVRFASQTNTPQAHPESALTSPAAATQTFPSPMRCVTRSALRPSVYACPVSTPRYSKARHPPSHRTPHFPYSISCRRPLRSMRRPRTSGGTPSAPIRPTTQQRTFSPRCSNSLVSSRATSPLRLPRRPSIACAK